MPGSSRFNAGAVLERVLLYLLLIVALILVLFPLYWTLITSVKTPGEAFRLPPTLWPQTWTLDAYGYMIAAWRYWQTLGNTVIVAGASALLATLLGGLAAYGFNRLQFRFRSLLFGFMVVSLALPGMVTIGPIFLAFTRLGLLDTLSGLVIVNVSGGLPLAMLTLYTFISAIPRDLDDAAALDGCSKPRLLAQIILPLATPGLIVSFLLVFIAVWNEFLFAFILNISPESRLLNVRLLEIPVRDGLYATPYDLISAGGMLCLLPLLPILIFARRRLVDGILAGSMRG